MNLKSGCFSWLLGGGLGFILGAQACAQTLPPPTDLPPEAPRRLDEILPTPSNDLPPAPPAPAAPPIPALELPAAPEIDADTTLEDAPANAAFWVQTITVRGSTVLTEAIRTIAANYENRELTLENLFALRTELTQLYIENGYINSGAFLPAGQDVTDGAVDIQVVEGRVDTIDVTGLRRLKEFYVRDRIALGLNTPFRQQELEAALQLLQLNPLFDQVNAELLASPTPGLSTLQLDVTEASHVQLAVITDNYRSPSIGSEQATVSLSHGNVWGLGDRFTASYGLTQGLNTYSLGYTVPVTSTDGSLTVRFSSSDADIVEGGFENLGIVNETFNLSTRFRQPIVRTPQTEFALGIAFDVRESQSFFFDDIPLPLGQGLEDGKSRVSVIRFSQDWINRDRDRVLAARSQFSLGIDAFDATVNDVGTDGRFLSWLGQLQWVQRLPAESLLVGRLSAQLTPDSLLPLEQFSLGGIDTVRGYRNNQFVTDNGIVGSLELRIPPFANIPQLQVTPFIEGGIGWDNDATEGGADTLASIGLGLQWQIADRLELHLDYGYPLIQTDDIGSSLQDNGLYFSINADLL